MMMVERGGDGGGGGEGGGGAHEQVYSQRDGLSHSRSLRQPSLRPGADQLPCHDLPRPQRQKPLPRCASSSVVRAAWRLGDITVVSDGEVRR
jgi:hypothetical protein